MIRRIVYATDFSKASRAALVKAIELAKTNRASLHVVHVLAPVVPLVGSDGYMSPTTFEKIERSNRQWAQKNLTRLLDKARAAGVKASGKVLEGGVPHEQIVRAARQADLLVVGTHGRTGMARFFLGSVAGRVAASAQVPVLTVRGG
jgi:nucleotide-binding universal stress UspA family protein